MSENNTPRKEVLQIAYDQVGNIIYLLGIAIAELVIRPLFGQKGVPLLAEATLLIMDLLFFLGLMIRLVAQIDKLILQLGKSHFFKIVKSIQFPKSKRNHKVRNTLIVIFLFLGFIWFNYTYITLRLELAHAQDKITQTQADLAAMLEYCKRPDANCDMSAGIEASQIEIMSGYKLAETLQKELNDFGNPIILVTLITTIILVVESTIYYIFRSFAKSESLDIET